MMGPIRANLTWDSAMLRHALRAAVIAAPALVITLIWQGAFTHWLTITVVLTMQPFYCRHLAAGARAHRRHRARWPDRRLAGARRE